MVTGMEQLVGTERAGGVGQGHKLEPATVAVAPHIDIIYIRAKGSSTLHSFA
ncbi:hypothetical protein ABBQ38_012681 [Trebouxia sp. C0009 RCD-2024]